MLTFNSAGYLTPNTAINSTVREFEEEFVVNYSSGDRSRLFEMYLQYCNDLKALCEERELLQWIDGSFVTKSKPSPSDIDMVTFIDAELIEKLGKKLNYKKRGGTVDEKRTAKKILKDWQEGKIRVS